MSRRVLPYALAAAALAGGGGCYQDDPVATADAGTSVTKVLLTDAPFPFDTVQSVNIYVVSVAVSATADTSPGGAAWITITAPRRRIDLLELQQGATALVGEGRIPADQYRAVRVIIDVDSSDIRFADGSPAVVDWGFGAAGEYGIHAFVEAALAVPEAGAEIVVDFDVGRSFRYDELGDGTFRFVPWIRAVNKAATGSIGGTVLADSAPLANATVSVYGASQGTTQIFSTASTDATGRYRVAYLLPGIYIVQVDAPAAAIWGSSRDSGVVVTTGAETDHSVNLTPFRGSVTIVGATSMLLGRNSPLEAIVTDSQQQQVPDPRVAWQTLDPAVLALWDTATATRYAWVTAVSLGTGRIVATSGGMSDTLPITVYPDSSRTAALAGASRRP